jgi:hypothetical protein
LTRYASLKEYGRRLGPSIRDASGGDFLVALVSNFYYPDFAGVDEGKETGDGKVGDVEVVYG